MHSALALFNAPWGEYGAILAMSAGCSTNIHTTNLPLRGHPTCNGVAQLKTAQAWATSKGAQAQRLTLYLLYKYSVRITAF